MTDHTDNHIDGHVDAVTHLRKAARPSRRGPVNNGALRPKAPTPKLATPAATLTRRGG